MHFPIPTVKVPTPIDVLEGDVVTTILSDIALAMIQGRGSHTVDSIPSYLADGIVRKLDEQGWYCETRPGVRSYFNDGSIIKASGSTTTFSWSPK